MSRAAVLLAVLVSGSAPRQDPAQPPASCVAVKEQALRYFGERASVLQSWQATRLCKMGEPSLLASHAPAVRCAYSWAFHPLVTIRISGDECSAEISAWDDRDEHHPRVVRERRQVSGCTQVRRRLRDAVSSGNQTPMTSEPVVPVDGGTLSLEVTGASGYAFGFSDLLGGLAPASKLTVACDALARAVGFSTADAPPSFFGSVTLALRDAARPTQAPSGEPHDEERR